MLVLVEGNISASKTTVVSGLDGCKAYEPLESENEFLEKFYADPKRYAADMQYFTLTTNPINDTTEIMSRIF